MQAWLMGQVLALWQRYMKYIILASAVLAGVGAIYARGRLDQRKAEQERKAKVVKKLEEEYAKIDQGAAGSDVADRLRQHNF